MSYKITLFSGVDANGREGVWETNGTSAGTFEIESLYGTSNKPYGEFTQLSDGKVLFEGQGSNGLDDLFITDGTTRGTYQISVQGASNSLSLDPTNLAALGNKVLFNGIDSNDNYGLWVSDGTVAGTAEISGTAGLDPRFMTAYAGKIYFASIAKRGLWSSNGTSGGTVEIAGTSGISPKELTVFNGQLYFVDALTGNFYVSNGTSAGTKNLGRLGNVIDLTNIGKTMVFEGEDGNGDMNLYASNGVSVERISGIGIFDNLTAASEDTGPPSPEFTVLGGNAYFEADGPNGGFALWETNGTAAGTHEITGIRGTLASGIFPSPGDPDFNGPNFALFNNELIFDGASAGGEEPAFGQTSLWVTGGTAASTHALTGIYGAGSPSVLGLDPSNMTTVTLPTQPVVTGVSFQSAPQQVNNGYVEFDGTIVPGSTRGGVKVYNGTTLLGTATLNYGSFDFSKQLAAGTYAALRIVVTNAAGTSVSEAAPFTITTGIKNLAYTDRVDELDIAGHVTGQMFYAQDNVYLSNVVEHLNNGVIAYYYYTGTYFETQKFSAFATFYSAGNSKIGTSIYYDNVQGQAYTGEELDYNGLGQLVRTNLTGMTAQPYSSLERDYIDGILSGSKRVYTTFATATAYSSEEVDYDFKNAVSGEKYFYTNLARHAYTGQEVDYNAAHQVTRVLETGFQGEPYSSHELDYVSGKYVAYKNFYTAISGHAYTGEELDYTAINSLTKVVYSGYTTTPYDSVERDYSKGTLTGLVYGYDDVKGEAYYGYEAIDNAKGTTLEKIFDDTNGSHTLVGYAAGLTFQSIGNDTITGGGASETFSLQPIYGHDTITDFYQHLGGAAHDTISLSTADFANFATVLAEAHYAGGNAIIEAKDHDTLTLDHMTEKLLAASKADFKFHA